MDHFVVLTAAPMAGLTDPQIAAIRAQLDAPGPARRLAPDAAEIPVRGRQSAEAEAIDVNCVPAAGRRKQLLIADMDSTIITVECIDEVADFAGVREQVVAITEPAMCGELSFEEALVARVALIKGLAQARLQDVYDQRVALTPGARALVMTMRAHGAYAVLVSGGFTFFSERIAAAAGFDEHRANRLVFSDGVLSGTVEQPILGREAKLNALREISGRLGIGLDAALAVGDGANDLAMIEAAGLGVAFRAKPIVATQADVSITHGDLTALLSLQGYTADEIVTD